MGNLNDGIRHARYAPAALDEYRLIDALAAERGRIYLTGTQALVRLLLMQRTLDRAAHRNTAGFVSGYRGSPLGGVDQQLWKNRELLDIHDVRFLPAINEELGATAVLGTQRLESDSERTVDGVFAMWYGKGPGVDRAADALKHGHAYGSSPNGGVLVVAGDDHGCVSSSMSHQSDGAMMAWHMPVLHPANVQEIIEFGLYGWALSRFSGAWVGLKAISETVESAGTVDLDAIAAAWTAPDDYRPPATGLHNRWPDFPGPHIEVRMLEKLRAVRAFARINSIDRFVSYSPHAKVGIVTCGKAHLDVLEALRRLGLGIDDLERAGVRLYKVGLAFPLETGRIDAFADGLDEIFVIEEKGPIVEQQIKQHLYNRPQTRPRVIGKAGTDGTALLSASDELRPSRILPHLAAWLAAHRPALDRRAFVDAARPLPVLSNAADGVRRVPYFCPGCSHNVATKVPQGSIAHAGIGCHFMASWMNRDTTGLIQMGGEGVDWVAQSQFSARPHVFQNLGDGTYFHSGILAIRQAIAAKANITYKVLHNAAVAMTGGQPVEGSLTVPQLAHQLTAEGVQRLAIVSDDIDKHLRQRQVFPPQATFHARDEMDALQRELREVRGVTALIYDQGCAAEKRRLRKKGKAATPNRRLFINEAVCEGCGDCGAKSNCLAVSVTETPLGRKRRIDQSSCNLDFSCGQGACPSFVSVVGAVPRKSRAPAAALLMLDEIAALLPAPALPELAPDAPFNLLVTGVGGTGVVTIGALVTMAAHLEGKGATVLDFMGFSQKGGAVLSFVRLGAPGTALNQVRIDVRQADLLLACDMVVAASPDALQTLRHGHTRVALNRHAIANASFVQDPDATLHPEALVAKIEHAAGPGERALCDAQQLAEAFLGDTIAANIVMLGMAWQRGWIPVALEALLRAIELNGVAVALNKRAFGIGRLAAADPDQLDRAMAREDGNEGDDGAAAVPAAGTDVDAVLARHEAALRAYGGAACARRYRALVDDVRTAERDRTGGTALTLAVAHNFARLSMVKDEWEVARLYADGAFLRALERQFEGVPGKDYRIEFHLSPPIGRKTGEEAVKRRFGPWMRTAFKAMAAVRGVRGTWLDPFRYQEERRIEQELIAEYETHMRQAAQRLVPQNLDAALALAALPSTIVGFGHVKLRNLARAKARETALAAQLGITLQRGPRVAAALARQAASGAVLRGIPIVKA